MLKRIEIHDVRSVHDCPHATLTRAIWSIIKAHSDDLRDFGPCYKGWLEVKEDGRLWGCATDGKLGVNVCLGTVDNFGIKL